MDNKITRLKTQCRGCGIKVARHVDYCRKCTAYRRLYGATREFRQVLAEDRR